MQAPGNWVPKEVGHRDSCVRALAMGLSHFLPWYPLSFPVALKSSLDLSCLSLSLAFPTAIPTPAQRESFLSYPELGGLQKATSMEGPELNPGASFPSCVHIPGQRQNCRVGRALGSRQVPVHVTDLEMEPQGVQRACSQSAHVWTSRILGAARPSPCAVNLGVESQFPTRRQARCCRLTSDKPAMGSV